MKKVCLLTVLCFIGISLQAQVQWGVKAGVNASRYSPSSFDILDPLTMDPIGKLKVDYSYGFLIGGTMNYGFSPSFSVQPELLFTLMQNSIGKANIRYQNFYLQLPVNLKYSHYQSNGNAIQLFAGPYVGYGLFGNIYENGKSVNDNIFDGVNDRFDYGLNFGIGYEINKKYVINASYLLGLQKMNPFDEKWRSFQLSVGYLF